MSQKRIAVVGGGFCGLSSIKALKEEGMEPVCFEKTSNPGGTWYYREKAVNGLPSIMPTTILNYSKEMGAFSNFPPKKEYANYMRHSNVYQYFKDIGEAFDCFRHMIYNREVVSVRRAQDYDETGRWTVTVRNTENGETATDIFDGVMVCVGHIADPKIPDFSDMKKFTGQIVHSHSLKRVDLFSGKKICVVGIGCSALDAAVEISSVAKQVYLSTRSGSWIMPRVGPYGIPMDYSLLRRYLTFFQEYLPVSVCSKFVEIFYLSQTFNHDLYNLQPQYHVLCKDPAINDALPSKLISGRIILKKNIKYFVANGIMFEGDDTITDIDTVIMATGYRWKFPFFEDDIITTESDRRINLYKCMWSPNLKHQTLSIIGFVLPFGPGFPIHEMQCRWAVQVFSGKTKLPSNGSMMKDIIKIHENNVKRYRPEDKMSIRVDFIPYMDDIASQFGAKPDFWKMLIIDPLLFKACIFGPSLSYQYRLQGPHKWKGARNAILTAGERMKAPLQKNKKIQKKRNFLSYIARYMMSLILLLFRTSWNASSRKYCLMAVILLVHLIIIALNFVHY